MSQYTINFEQTLPSLIQTLYEYYSLLFLRRGGFMWLNALTLSEA